MFRPAALSSALFVLATFCFSTAVHASNPLRVKIDSGEVEGAFANGQQVRAFKGIPFAAPPVGDLRWKAPQAEAAWKGVRKAKDFGSHCIQSGSYPDMVFHDPGPSEDCLTLNVWTPANAKTGSLPVMVWIYGGGFSTGGTSESRQDGQFLAARDVVVVSMNYRLGIFGFFNHPELTMESPFHASGNYGLLDQAAALAWVHRNIAAFGGDPNNVTIFGESAGSQSVSAHMASPVSRGLFNKAIGESGGEFPNDTPKEELGSRLEERNVVFAKETFGTSSIADLRKFSADEILRAAMAKTMPPPPRFRPSVDGYFLPDSVANAYARGVQVQVPLLAGWNADESRGQVLLSETKTTADSFTAAAHKDFGEKAKDFLAAYSAETDAEAVVSAGDYAGDRFIAYSTWKWLEMQVLAGQAPVYRYRMDLGSPGDKNHQAILGAFHSDDIEYVFGTLDSRPGAVWRPEDRKLSELMGAYWTNFARTGDPNGPGLPQWPVYKSEKWQVMHLDATSAAKPDAQRERYLFLDIAWGQAAR